MYISKKILSIFLLLLSFAFGIVYATNNISGLTESVNEGDIITAEYYNNLNGSKSEGKFCKYSGGKLVCIDDISSIIGVVTFYGPYANGTHTLGSHIYCSINKMGNAEDAHYCDVYKTGSTWYLKHYKTGCIASCLD